MCYFLIESMVFDPVAGWIGVLEETGRVFKVLLLLTGASRKLRESTRYRSVLVNDAA